MTDTLLEGVYFELCRSQTSSENLDKLEFLLQNHVAGNRDENNPQLQEQRKKFPTGYIVNVLEFTQADFQPQEGGQEQLVQNIIRDKNDAHMAYRNGEAQTKIKMIVGGGGSDSQNQNQNRKFRT